MSSTSFGEHLRRERELRGVSLNEIAAATRISTRFLEALENEQWDRLPGGAFNRGFIRSIARFLGLDEEGLVSEYAYEHNSIDGPGSAGHSDKIPRKWGSVVLAILVALLLLAGGSWIIVHFRTAIAERLHLRFAQGTLAADSALPASATPNSLPVSAGAALALTIQASKPAKLTVTTDGQNVFAGSLQVSDVKQFEAHETIEIASSDSTAFLLTLNGRPMPWSGPPGEPGAMTLTQNDLQPPPEASH